ncbi:ras-related protein Rab-34 [Anoplophora glabripennis]|uniref:ras-related protein Rab-34 n=1 Tax=Anoplophora glabripennis TaxID=217634 RepID=UPI0008739242|nr:ras-related protein Rab-34 [Anoplophora glabripennis]
MPQVQGSNILKMLKDEAPEDRRINSFPEPYRLEYTPYHTINFSERAYKKCLEEKINWLKLSKVIVIGDVSVGKTSIVNRFCKKIFDSNYKSTIGVDFEVERFDILRVPYNLQIWDTAGQERFKSIAQSYYRGTQAIIVVFDYTNVESLYHCKNWLSEALTASSSLCPFIFLVGTKLDLMKKYALKNMEVSVKKVAKRINAEYWSVSSKTGKNVNNLFFRIAALCFEESIKRELELKEKEVLIGTKLTSSNKNDQREFKSKCEGLKCVK